MKEKIRKSLQRLQRFADRWWYFPVVGLLAGIDLFILIVPTDAILVSSVMLQPRKWISAFIWIALGSATGALVLASLVQWDPVLVTEHWFPHTFDSALWQSTDGFFDKYGDIALFLIACSPLVQFPAVLLAGLSGMPLMQIFFVVLFGRALKTAIISWGASHAPRLLFKLPFMRRELQFLNPTPDEVS